MKWDLLAFVYLFFQEEVHDGRSLKEMGQDLLRLELVIHYGNKLRPEENFPISLMLFTKKCARLHLKIDGHARWPRSTLVDN